MDEEQGFYGEGQRIVAEMYLIIFDRSPSTNEATADKKIWQTQEQWQDQTIGVWGM